MCPLLTKSKQLPTDSLKEARALRGRPDAAGVEMPKMQVEKTIRGGRWGRRLLLAGRGLLSSATRLCLATSQRPSDGGPSMLRTRTTQAPRRFHQTRHQDRVSSLSAGRWWCTGLRRPNPWEVEAAGEMKLEAFPLGACGPFQAELRPVTFSLWWMCLSWHELPLSRWVLAHKSSLNPGEAERLVPWRRQARARAFPSSYSPFFLLVLIIPSEGYFTPLLSLFLPRRLIPQWLSGQLHSQLLCLGNVVCRKKDGSLSICS